MHRGKRVAGLLVGVSFDTFVALQAPFVTHPSTHPTHTKQGRRQLHGGLVSPPPLPLFPLPSPPPTLSHRHLCLHNRRRRSLDMIAILKAQPAKPRVFIMQPTPLYKQNVFGCMNQTITNFVLRKFRREPPVRIKNPAPKKQTLTPTLHPLHPTKTARLLPTVMAASEAEPQIIDLFNALGGANLTQPNITCDGCQ
jgi:hypothetical protein